MSATMRGTTLAIVQRFWRIDPVTEIGQLSDPDQVTFQVADPDQAADGTGTVYTFGTDLNVENPSPGIYVCLLAPPLPTGTYTYLANGTWFDGSQIVQEASQEGTFTVLASGVLLPAGPSVASPGPCTSWISGEDVANCGPDLPGVGSNTYLLDEVAYDASAILYELGGRLHPGVCTRTVRPCRTACSCFGMSPSLGLGPWYWMLNGWGGTLGFWGWGWYSEDGGRCGCGTESVVDLAGYPVREILEVKIDGVVLPLLDVNNNPNYRLDDRRRLLRMDDPGPPLQNRRWPACQNMSLDDTQSGTFAITYTWGADVPGIGKAAAAQLARELWNACTTGQCALPTRATRIVRQGIEIDRVVPLAAMLRSGSTGLQLVDAFIASVNPTGMQRQPAVWSPDLPRYARRVGQ